MIGLLGTWLIEISETTEDFRLSNASGYAPRSAPGTLDYNPL